MRQVGDCGFHASRLGSTSLWDATGAADVVVGKTRNTGSPGRCVVDIPVEWGLSGPVLPNMTPAARWSHGELDDLLVVAVLGVGEGEAAVDLEGLAAGVPAVGLDEGVVDAG